MLTKANWYAQLDDLFVNEFGIGWEDMEDYTWESLREDGYSPQEAFDDYLEYSDYFDEE
jgi:hypothetical protein